MGAKRRILNTFSDDDSAVDNYENSRSRVIESPKKGNDESVPAELELIMKRKRSVILDIATKTGIKESDSWTSFNDWMLKRSIYKKRLYDYDYEELDQLTKQFRALEVNYKRSSEKVGTKAWHHARGIPGSSAN